jgi:hypothetical protein
MSWGAGAGTLARSRERSSGSARADLIRPQIRPTSRDASLVVMFFVAVSGITTVSVPAAAKDDVA